ERRLRLLGVRAGSLQKRAGALEYERNTAQAIDTYASVAIDTGAGTTRLF
ncbi:MAG: hypothetical protein JSR49_09400, partial [Proteobacteria bacterium]|nr:hypothetical protein [Pseudomonadota bacterium]